MVESKYTQKALTKKAQKIVGIDFYANIINIIPVGTLIVYSLLTWALPLFINKILILLNKKRERNTMHS